LFVEPKNATLAVVEVADGSIAELHRQPLPAEQGASRRAAHLATMVAGLDGRGSRVDGVFLIGCGADIVSIKPALEAVTSLQVSAPEEPDTALARGAALASANAPLFASSTAALAYALDPATGDEPRRFRSDRPRLQRPKGRSRPAAPAACPDGGRRPVAPAGVHRARATGRPGPSRPDPGAAGRADPGAAGRAAPGRTASSTCTCSGARVPADDDVPALPVRHGPDSDHPAAPASASGALGLQRMCVADGVD
jgi:hypothetical protein